VLQNNLSALCDYWMISVFTKKIGINPVEIKIIPIFAALNQ